MKIPVTINLLDDGSFEISDATIATITEWCLKHDCGFAVVIKEGYVPDVSEPEPDSASPESPS